MAPRRTEAGRPGLVQTGRALSTGGYVVLGLLLDGPASGWDLARTVERSIAHFWPVTKAHIYTELPKLAALGWAGAAHVPQDDAPDKRVYSATTAGREAFAAWLATVDLTEEKGRQPLQLQLFFAAHAAPERIRELLDTWQIRAEEAERHCLAILARKGVDIERLPRLVLPDSVGGSAPSNAVAGLDLRGMTALFGLRRAQADLSWLTEVEPTSPATKAGRSTSVGQKS